MPVTLVKPGARRGLARRWGRHTPPRRRLRLGGAPAPTFPCGTSHNKHDMGRVFQVKHAQLQAARTL